MENTSKAFRPSANNRSPLNALASFNRATAERRLSLAPNKTLTELVELNESTYG